MLRLLIFIFNNAQLLLRFDMGNNQEKQEKVAHSIFQSSHPLYKTAAFISEGGKSYIQTRAPAQEKEYQKWKNIILDSKKPLHHQFLLLPEHTGFQHDKEICSNTGTVINNYPNYSINLAEQISRRQPEKLFFKESQVWYLLYALIAAKRDLRNHDGRIGDIRPANIFINEHKNVKIVNLYSSHLQKTSFQKAKEIENGISGLLLAPEDLPDLEKGTIDNKHNIKSQMFAIGATVISAGLLDNFIAVYNDKNFKFSLDELGKIKDRWAQHPNYSEIFKSIVLNLVNEEPTKRISIEDLYRFVHKYESAIKAKQQFIITHPPENLESGVSLVRSKAH